MQSGRSAVQTLSCLVQQAPFGATCLSLALDLPPCVATEIAMSAFPSSRPGLFQTGTLCHIPLGCPAALCKEVHWKRLMLLMIGGSMLEVHQFQRYLQQGSPSSDVSQ